MSGHRHAAGVLYGVNTADQEAVLHALPVADQRILRAHLLELRALGFDAGTVRAAAGSPPPIIPNDTAGRLHTALRGADAGAMRSVLAHEPAELIADVLALEEWPWSAALLTALPTNQKVALRLMADRQAPTPALGALLLERLSAHMPAISIDGTPADAMASSVPPSLLKRWTRWMR